VQFGLVSGASQGMGRPILGLDRGPRSPRRRGGFDFEVFPIGLNGVFFNRNVFDSCVKS